MQRLNPKKATVFKLKKGNKTLNTVAFDLAKYVGNKNDPIEINFDKGVKVSAEIEVMPACRVKHAHLFDMSKAYGASKTVQNSNASDIQDEASAL